MKDWQENNIEGIKTDIQVRLDTHHGIDDCVITQLIDDIIQLASAYGYRNGREDMATEVYNLVEDCAIK